MKGFKDSTRTKYECGGRVMRKQEGGAVSRANRTQREEAREEAKLLREVPARPTRGNRPNYTVEPTPTPTPQSTRAPRRPR
jgi:hypothetical protein